MTAKIIIEDSLRDIMEMRNIIVNDVFVIRPL